MNLKSVRSSTLLPSPFLMGKAAAKKDWKEEVIVDEVAWGVLNNWSILFVLGTILVKKYGLTLLLC